MEVNLFLETDLALHEHCGTCVNLSNPSQCASYGCAIIGCPHECGCKFHSCKTEEHLLLCPLVKAQCINACYGCPLWMLRRELGPHLVTCPASVVYCNMERNRKPLKEFGKMLKKSDGHVEDEKFLPDPGLGERDLSLGPQRDQDERDLGPQGPQDDQLALDLCLAYSDQRQINNLYRYPRSERKSATNFFNKRHPALPLFRKSRISDHEITDPPDMDKEYPDEEGDSSDDEAEARKRAYVASMSPVALECILCKIDPSSQHLHQLRGTASLALDSAPILNLDQMELDENANSLTKGKPWLLRNVTFYADRSLMIDLSADFLPAHYPKCGSYYTIVCDQSVRRDEYAKHFSNVHNDIVDGLDGWALIRCPMWRYGCAVYATRLEPDGRQSRRIVYNRYTDAFALKSIDIHSSTDRIAQSRFLALPYDILHLVCTMLDPGSLFCLASTCRNLNEFVRFCLLPSRGIVEREWLKCESKTAHGRSHWIQGVKRWRLSKTFDRVQNWRMRNMGKFVDHIQKCPFYEPLIHKQERIPVLTFAKPFASRPNRRDMYRSVPLAIDNNLDDPIDDVEQEIFDF